MNLIIAHAFFSKHVHQTEAEYLAKHHTRRQKCHLSRV